MRNIIVGLALVAASSAAEAQVVVAERMPFPEARKFSVVIERSGYQWKAKCELGCRWTGTTMGFTCKENCDAVLDWNGLHTAKSERDPNAAFAFVLSANDDGSVNATPIAGTVWLRLGWSCESKTVCSARVNEFGVQGGRGFALEKFPSR